jgi:2-isopropylmalate synthase
VRIALGCTNEENLESIRASVDAAIQSDKEAMVDCEHFFDGYKANPDYALACVHAALDSGARWVVLCDTNGGTLPSEVRDIVGHVIASGAPGEQLGIHAHDDTGQAVANSLAAVEAGVRQIQGTLNGIGERCGNANLITIIPTLMLKPRFADRFAKPACLSISLPILRACRAPLTSCSTAHRKHRHPMSARPPSPPKLASTLRPSSRNRRPMSTCRLKRLAIAAGSWCRIRGVNRTLSPS